MSHRLPPRNGLAAAGRPRAGRGAYRKGRGMATAIIAITDHVFHGVEPERAAAAALGAELRVGQCRTPEDVLALTRDADAVLNCYAPMPASVIDQLERCKIIARYGIGVDTVDLAAATRKGIAVTNVPDYCVDEVSDHALALLLSWARKIVVANAAVHAGSWQLADVTPVRRLRGQTLGLVGLGKIALRLAAKAQALGLRVIGTDPYVPAERVAPLGITATSLDDVLAESDFLSLHAPLTPDTRGMLNAAALAKMKPDALVINTARGPLIDGDALVDALASHRIGGAALDVVPVEPLPAESPLRTFENVMLTPHMAYYSEQSLRDLQQEAVDEVVRALRGEPQKSLVNREILTQAATPTGARPAEA
jgi:D-3-phosphoglycerate dehydrogenase